MARPSWLAGTLAAVMIGIAVYTVSRLAASRRWRRPTELDADGVHVFMGIAMAGTLAPRLSSLPAWAWEAVFGAAAAWFAVQAVRGRRGAAAGPWRCAYPLPHLVESLAMLYMFLALRASRPGTAMPVMGGPAAAARFPALPFAMALFLLGYVVWTADRLTSLAPAAAVVPAQASAENLGSGPFPAQAGTRRTHAAAAGDTPSTRGALHLGAECQPVLAPRMAACYKIAMGITMGYMLILMA